MTDALLLLPALRDAPFAGRALADHLVWLLESAGLRASGERATVVFDGRYAAVSAESLRWLAAGPSRALRAPGGQRVAVAIPGGIATLEQDPIAESAELPADEATPVDDA